MLMICTGSLALPLIGRRSHEYLNLKLIIFIHEIEEKGAWISTRGGKTPRGQQGENWFVHRRRKLCVVSLL